MHPHQVDAMILLAYLLYFGLSIALFISLVLLLARAAFSCRIRGMETWRCNGYTESCELRTALTTTGKVFVLMFVKVFVMMLVKGVPKRVFELLPQVQTS